MMRASIQLPPFDPAKGPFPPGEQDVINADAVIRFIRREWSRCLTWILAAVGAGIVFAMLSPAYYTAYTTILLEDRALRPPAELLGGAMAIDPTYSESQVQVLLSDEVLGRVVDQNRLGESEEFGKARSGLRALVPELIPALFGPRAQVTPRYAATVNVKRALSVKRLGTSNAVEIDFTSRNPDSAATIANAIAETYIDSQLELKRQAHADAASQLRDRLFELRSKAFPADPPAVDSLHVTVEAGEQAQNRFRELQDSAEAYRTLYNSFLQRNYTESIDASSFPGARVITSAQAPAERSWPRPGLVLAVVVACGLAGGIGHALLRRVTNHRLRTVEDVEATATHAFVAGIPMLRSPTLCRDGNSQHEGLQPAYAVALVGSYALMGKVAAKLQAATNQENKSKKGAVRSQGGSIIGVVAPTDGSGASLIAADLARVIAESGQRSLLVDANWRKPTGATPGLDADDPRALERTRTTIQLSSGTLDILMLRAVTPISELSAARSIASALEDLEAEYDWIIVDFLSTEQTADLEVNASIINTAIVVVEAERTSSESLRATLQVVPKHKVGAIVLNKTRN